ncbi:hypothetical protein EI94DRAFT_138109 [Lactarius quietus]|nr:hypothetical protein EI94DRAFT_138109 [Lactarius quietus]
MAVAMLSEQFRSLHRSDPESIAAGGPDNDLYPENKSGLVVPGDDLESIAPGDVSRHRFGLKQQASTSVSSPFQTPDPSGRPHLVTSHWPFPLPFSLPAPVAIPLPNRAINYLTAGYPQSYGRYPQSRATLSPLLPPHALLPSQYQPTYPPTPQHTLVSSRPHPAFPTSQVDSTYAPTTHFGWPTVPPIASTNPSDPPSRVQRSVMPTPGPPSNTHGHYDFLREPVMYPAQSYSEKSGATSCHGNQDDYDTSVTHNSGTNSKGPPLIVGIAAPVIPPESPTVCCRLFGCQTTMARDIAERYSGFCCSRHLSYVTLSRRASRQFDSYRQLGWRLTMA